MKKRSFFIGYRKRILLSIAFLVVLITLSLTIYGTTTTGRFFKTHLEQTGTYLSQNLAHNSELGIFAEDTFFLAPALAAILQNEDAVWACVYNHTGAEIACVTNGDITIPPVPPALKISLQHTGDTDVLQSEPSRAEGIGVIDFYAPIYISAQPHFDPFFGELDKRYDELRFMGFARVGLSLENLTRTTRELTATAAMLFAFTLFLGIIAVWYIEKRITAPVREIAEGAARIAEGDLDTRIPVNTEDELGELASEFNTMAEKLNEYHSEIIKRGDFLENLIESANSIIVETDTEYRIKRFNRFAEETFQHTKQEAIGQNAVTLLIAPQHQHQALELFSRPHIHGGYQCTCITKDGTHRTVSWINSLIMEKDGTNIGLLLIGTDITEKIQIEQQLFHSEKLKSLGEMAGGVAHDFNNLLAAIVGRVQLIKRQLDLCSPQTWDSLKQKLHTNLDIIEKASQDGAETVKRIQTFAKLRRDETEFEKIDIPEQIENALEFTRARWKNLMESEGKKIVVHKTLGDTPAVLGNPVEIREVFTNLINNALDAMPEGGELFFRTTAGKNLVTIEIEDSGAGIPDEIKERVFDPFYSTKGAQSSGLGLSICHGIVARHKGIIRIENRQGKGTRFLITLPVYTGNRPQPSRSTNFDMPISGKTILVIEDDQNVRDLLADMLTEDGHIVQTASCGKEGIEKFSAVHFDFVFTDLGMDDMSGWEVTKAIKQLNSRVPVAVVTGWGAQIDEEEKMKNLADEIVNKPFSLEKIREVIHKFDAIAKKDRPVC